MYYATNMENETALDVTTSTVIGTYIKTFKDFSKDGAKIKYTLPMMLMIQGRAMRNGA